MPFQKQNLKAPLYAKAESQCENHVFTTNLQKLWFYQNKGMSLDRHCRVPNTFPTRNQTFGPKN